MLLVIIKFMQLTLSPVEVRVLGALIEKEITTPEYYPLSLNALANACNQKSNRDPVVHLEESDIRRALNHLESQSLVRSIGDSRVTKFEQRLQETFNLYRPELAVICELLLRGPQTPGELRNRASRMHPFEDLESVHSALQRLAKRQPPMVAVLPRQPGSKEARYAHLLGDAPPTSLAHEEPLDTFAVASTSPEPPEAVQITALAAEVAELRSELASLRAQFAEFMKQFD